MFRINGGAGVDRDVFFCVEKPSCILEQVICCSWQEGFSFQHLKICPQAWACIADDVSMKALKSADVSQWSFQDKIKVLLMKNQMTNALYAILKR